MQQNSAVCSEAEYQGSAEPKQAYQDIRLEINTDSPVWRRYNEMPNAATKDL
jgi:hypothetical protein